jgi:hypothetical protein
MTRLEELERQQRRGATALEAECVAATIAVAGHCFDLAPVDGTVDLFLYLRGGHYRHSSVHFFCNQQVNPLALSLV